MKTKGKVVLAFLGGAAVTSVGWIIYDRKVFNKAIETAVEQVLSEEGRLQVLEAADEELKSEESEEDKVGIIVEDYESHPVSRNPDPTPEAMVKEADILREDKMEANKISAEQGYLKSMKAAEQRLQDIKDGKIGDRITIINADEFAENPDYDTEFYTSFADQIVADDNGNVIADIEDLVSRAALDPLQDYVTNIMFVRNDTQRCYYQICQSSKRFADLTEFDFPLDEEDDLV